MHLEIKNYIEIPPEKETLDKNQEYPGYIKMTDLDDLDIFNYAFGRSDGYPSGKVVFCVDGEPLQFNANVSELYTFWYSLIKSLITKNLYDIEKSDKTLFYENELISNSFFIRFLYSKKRVEFHYKNQDFHYTVDDLGTFSLDDYKKAVLQGFLDFMWHTNLEFETIGPDTEGDEIDYAAFREDLGDALYNCRYIFLQFMKEIYKQKIYDLDNLINLDFDISRSFSNLEYDFGD